MLINKKKTKILVKIVAMITILILLINIESPSAAEIDVSSKHKEQSTTFVESFFIDEELGKWEYESSTLQINIERKTDKITKSIWYLAEIIADESEVFRCISSSSEEKTEWPAIIASENNVVFAINSDFHHLRLSNNSRTGIIIRNGYIIGEKTYAHNKGSFPNLDTMAIYPDGRLEVYPSDQFSGQEYLDDGVLDVLSFGPYLIKDGLLNEAALEKYGKSRAPRTGIGMVKPGHYYAIMVEGRHEKSKGVPISFLAERLYDLGCVSAFNLDGGQTATMIFMGKQIIKIGKSSGKNASARKSKEILGIGTTTIISKEDKPK